MAASRWSLQLAVRILQVLRLDRAAYDDIDADASATWQALTVVALAAAAHGLLPGILRGFGGQRESLTGAVVLSLAQELGTWIVGATVMYLLGTRVFHARSMFWPVVRVLGFARAPGLLLLVLAAVPWVGWPWLAVVIMVVCAAWQLCTGYVAIQVTLDLDIDTTVAALLVGYVVVPKALAPEPVFGLAVSILAVVMTAGIVVYRRGVWHAGRTTCVRCGYANSPHRGVCKQCRAPLADAPPQVATHPEPVADAPLAHSPETADPPGGDCGTADLPERDVAGAVQEPLAHVCAETSEASSGLHTLDVAAIADVRRTLWAAGNAPRVSSFTTALLLVLACAELPAVMVPLAGLASVALMVASWHVGLRLRAAHAGAAVLVRRARLPYLLLCLALGARVFFVAPGPVTLVVLAIFGVVLAGCIRTISRASGVILGATLAARAQAERVSPSMSVLESGHPPELAYIRSRRPPLGALGALSGCGCALIPFALASILCSLTPLLGKLVVFLGSPRSQDADAFLIVGAVMVVPFTLAALLFYYVAVPRAFQREQATYAIDAEEALRVDPRSPVLYLRSFKDDRLRSRAPNVDGRSWVESLQPASAEEILANRLWRYGPVIAIGKPGEHLPSLGAARDYVPLGRQQAEETWRGLVSDWMVRAEMVVVMVDRTEGLTWEIATLVAHDRWARVALVLPPVGQKELRARWEGLSDAVVQAGGPPLHKHIDLKRAIVVIPGQSPNHVIMSDHRDYVSYQVAAEVAAALVLGDARARRLDGDLLRYRSPLPARELARTRGKRGHA